MSYAGTYGPDETCRHDTYWRSCAECSLVGPRATAEQSRAAREAWDARIAEEQAERERKRSERHTHIVVTDGYGKVISREEVPE